MTNTEFYKILNSHYNNEAREVVISGIDWFKIRAQLEEAIQAEAVKKSAGASKAAILKRLFRADCWWLDDFKNTYVNIEGADGWHIFLNGFYGFFTKNTYNIEKENTTFGLKNAKNLFDEWSECDAPEIEIDIAGLKKHIAIEKAARKNRNAGLQPYVFKFSEDRYVGFNPEYLLDCLNFCNTSSIRITGEKKPAYITGPEEGAILCPVVIQ